MRRREFLALAAAPRPRRPNVLLLLPDQLRPQALGCMGNRDARTPHFDRLAREGLLLRNTFANSPVCCPARAILMTGQYCHVNGMVANDLRLRESRVTIAEILQGQGYRTGFIGKWHLDGGPRLPGYVPPGPRRQGFEFWAANECSHSHFKTQYFRDSPEPIPVDRFEPEAWTDEALAFLRQSSRERRPFFLCVFMGPPHDPYRAPDQYTRLFDPEKLEMRPNWKPAEGLPGRKEIAAYYAATTAVDEQVGRILASLDELGMAEDTIVLVSSDHGDMLGSHGQRLKRKPWEESIRVPGILRYPRRVKPGRSEEALFSHIDFAPTLLALCGVRARKTMQGANLADLVVGASRRAPDSVFFQIFGPYAGDRTEDGWRGVRTARYMYARYRSRPWVLYDLEKDPYQMNNLVDDAALRGQMEERLARWMRQTGDSWDFNWSAPVEDKGRLYTGGTYYTVADYLREHERF
jgi:arylsulfatase A-like enzyme